MRKLLKKTLRALANYDPDYYDMRLDPDEAAHARLYLEPIRAHLDAAGIKPPAAILDAGCQTGRLLIPLAEAGYRMTGVDTSGFALRRAQKHAKSRGCRATFVRSDISRYAAARPRPFDAVICAEVIYQAADLKAMLLQLRGLARPGGLVIVSHRLQAYYLFEALWRRDLATADRVLREREGHLPQDGAMNFFNWQTPKDLRALYAQLNMEVLGLHPIDQICWLTGRRPSQMPEQEREDLPRRERETAAFMPSVGRYALVAAVAP